MQTSDIDLPIAYSLNSTVPAPGTENEYSQNLQVGNILLVVLISLIIFIASFYLILRQAIIIFKQRIACNESLNSFSSQGQAFKAFFFVALFTACLLRSFSLVIFGISQGKISLIMTSIILWGLPTLLIVNAFSLFTYYMAKLNDQIEKSKEHTGYTPRGLEARLSIEIPAGNAVQKSKNVHKLKISLLKPFFVFFNFLAFISFVIITLSYFKEVTQGIQNSGVNDWWVADQFDNFSKAMKGLTGFIFMVLGIAILNYGTKLETAVSNSMNVKEVNNEVNGLDLRILTLTILLSLVFLCRSLIDTLYAWNFLQTNLQSPYIDLVLILFTEIAPAFIVTHLMKKKDTEIEKSPQQHGFTKQNRGKSSYQNIRSPHYMKEKLLTFQKVQYYSGIAIDKNDQDNSDDEDSTFGSFNPNLKTSSHNKHISNRGSSYETLNKLPFTNSFHGHLLLEKAPDEQLLNGYGRDELLANNNIDSNKKYQDFELERTIVHELPQESFYTMNSDKANSSFESI